VNAEVITVGTELLLGQILDTNSLYLSRKLAEIGVNLYYKTSVGDNTGRLKAALEIAAGRADIIVITGGLGPTVDDITRDGIAEYTGRKLLPDNETMLKLEHFFKARRIKMSENNRVQAYIPEGATVIENRAGTAPGFIIEQKGKVIAAMPGVPSEMRPMMENAVIPFLLQKYGIGKNVIRSRSLKVVGLPESLVDEKIHDLFVVSENPSIGVYAHQTEIEVRLTAKAENTESADAMIEGLKQKVYGRIGDAVYGEEEETLEGKIAEILLAGKMTVSTAESCTAGLLSFRLTNIAGSSAYFMGGINAYSNEVKKSMLGVPEHIIEKYGAVSAECAEAMAKMSREKFKTDCAVSVTGIAGPGGGTDEKPVGLVYMGIDIKGSVKTSRHLFTGSRDMVRARAGHTALFNFYKLLKN
jgi:nicotinamide-nucleotide amidase